MTGLSVVRVIRYDGAMSEVSQERVRLLLAMKDAVDFYDLHFAIAEHFGYVRGLYLGGQISSAVMTVFGSEATSVAQVSADRLAGVTA